VLFRFAGSNKKNDHYAQPLCIFLQHCSDFPVQLKSSLEAEIILNIIVIKK